MGTAYRDIDFICNGKTSDGNTISDGNVLCTHGRDPSLVDDDVSGVVPVLLAPQMLLVTAEAKATAMAARLTSMSDWMAVVP
jgi:hypothetical protein